MTGEHEARVIVGRCPGAAGRGALRYAVGLARMYRCPLFVVDVVSTCPPIAPFPLAPVDVERLRPDRRAQVAAELDVAAGDVLDGVDIRIAVVRGEPSATLDQLADRPG